MSYKTPVIKHTRLRINTAKEGQPIELKIERMLEGKEPMTGESPLLFTDRKDGVNPATDIRTDRWGIAVEGGDKIAKSYKARRDNNQKMKTGKNAEGGDTGKNGGPESTNGTQQSSTK